MKYKTESIDNIKKFYDINSKTGLTPTQVTNSRIKYGHNNFEETKWPKYFSKTSSSPLRSHEYHSYFSWCSLSLFGLYQ